ncbi:KAT8 regulatory NSL complex subunit 2-like [Mercenaria mercenaria]|uniref:KAT8 regulatory NSL complex subunit 2-like n=1 Tax=Mercenaria mercenaria TaxID=6596 RepID=UPI00234EF88B|nr:KAT8 regulatory NSL complex subunit 2-like [Mercenaria mercenaria]XP_053408819.1 KAT8 regulatory NSL complex subunit 2-like [Mercenaria mercenaria]
MVAVTLKMFRTSRTSFLNNGRTKTPVEGLFCMYSHRVCMQNRLEGYEYCLKHILEDKNAPFKQCSYTSGKLGKRCTNASPKSDRKDGYCVEHARRAMLIRQRTARKKRPKESPETLLEGLDQYTTFGRGHYDGHKEKSFTVASKALEYASSSDSDAETPVVDQAWRGDGDSDAESVDSEQEDLLKHAGVYTAEEVALIMRDKLIRLQSLYIDQFKRLQHVMKEKRRKYLHTVDVEREMLGGVGQYAKDVDSQENWNRYTAMKRYHRRFGGEALLHRQSKERRIAVSEGSNYKPPALNKCNYIQLGEKCQNPIIPLSKYCLTHILHDSHQVLFRKCRFGDGECGQPVATQEDVPYCSLHPRLPKDLDTSSASLSESTAKIETPTEDIIDVTTDVPMETGHALSKNHIAVETNEHKQGTSSPGEPVSEEALMKKGKYLFHHLKNLDPHTGEFTSPEPSSVEK